MIEYLTLLLAIPLGIILAGVTKPEKNIYSKPPYFPVMIWILAILSAIFLNIDKIIGMSLLFTFLTLLVWNRA
jgi:hypothetical protein